MDAHDVRQAVLDRVSPSEEEEEQSQQLFERIRDFVQDAFDRDAALMGSTAKGTFMSGDKDLDIFVFFPTAVPEDELETAGLDIGEAVFDEFGGDYEVEYAEHPYTRGDIEGYEVEIVPAYDVESGRDIKSSVDRTPFHREWVNDRLDSDEKDEVRLLKAFLRGQELYGSSLTVRGFSGYLCELLVAAHGSFEAVLEAAVDWDEEEVIDPGDHHDTLPAHLRQKFSDEPLVVVDPVDPERNVAAVLSRENYARFVYAAWRYRRAPDTRLFFPDETPTDKEGIESAADARGDFVTVEFATPDMVDDLLYPQLRRLQSRLETVLREHEFRQFHSGFHVGEERTRLLFELFSRELPRMRKHRGPRVFHNVDHLANFSEKYGDVWVEGTRLTTIVEREFRDAEQLLDDFLTGDLQAKGVPEQLVPVVEDATVNDLPLDGDSDDWRRFLRDEFHVEAGR